MSAEIQAARLAAEAVPASRKRRALKVVEPLCLIAVPLMMGVMALTKMPNFAVVSAVLVTLSMVPFFMDFEVSHLRARDLMPVVVMSALCVAGRLVFAPLPAIKPVTAIVIVTALSFGRQTGFLTGALAMLVSNIFFGQGPWTPWQMYSYGLIGYLTGTFADKGWVSGNRFIYVYGFVASYFYGAIMDTWTLLGLVQPWTLATVLITYGNGALYNLGHAVGTVAFLIPIARTWPRKFERVKLKYGLGGGSRGPVASAAGDAASPSDADGPAAT